jgi:hypothetical protein
MVCVHYDYYDWVGGWLGGCTCRKCRDELSHNIFLMLQECNKFREHQAREILIQTLEQQLVVKQEALTQLKEHLSEADAALTAIHAIESSSIIDS